jgi:hypothetical protein
VPLLFAVTLFVSASLLFMVQPMVGKLVLPLLGGSPAVWNACMVFFQALLLLGYLYADRLTRKDSPRKQWIIHLAVMALPVGVFALAVLFGSRHTPIAVAESLAPSDGSSAILSVLAILTVAIGVPFFVVSTSATLLQKWFTYTGHPSARDPYFLYAASNFGSLISLLGYPIFIEPNMTQGAQTWLWAGGFAALFGLIAYCGHAAVNPLGVPPGAALATASGGGKGGKQTGGKPSGGAGASPASAEKAPVDPPGEPAPSWARVAKWTVLAFVPSSLMLGVTFHMTTDIASVPLLWVGPLALYLVTFIIAFGRTPSWFRILIGNLAPVMILLLVFLMISEVRPGVGLELLLYNLTFFAAALMCHYELARDRPAPQHLTTYFLIMSFGGVLGGIFNSLIAPLVFTHAYEFPLALIIACLMVPKLTTAEEPEGTETATASTSRAASLAAIFGWVEFWCVLAMTLAFVFGTVVIYGLGSTYEWFRTPLLVVLPSLAGLGVVAVVGMELVALIQKRPIGLSQRLWRRCPWWGRLLLLSLLSVVALPWAIVGTLWSKERLRLFLDFIVPVLIGLAFLQLQRMPQKYEWYGKMITSVSETLGKGKWISPATILIVITYALPVMVCFFFVDRPLRFALCVAAILGPVKYRGESAGTVHTERTFFGILKIEESATVFRPDFVTTDGEPGPTGGIEYLRLVHGTTLHGTQVKSLVNHPRDLLQMLTINPWDNVAVTGAITNFDMRQEPLTYYHRTGPVGAMFNELRARKGGADARADVAMVGLGTGSVACYALQGQKLTFYEIDPAVRKLVETPWKVMNEKEVKEKGANPIMGPFTFVDDARKRGAEIKFRMGDARLKLKEDTDSKYALLLVDAFSSDSIPVHLLTNEAVQLYLDRLTDDGILALHISNKFVKLEPVVAAIAEHHNLVARVWNDDAEKIPGKTASSWVVLARKREDLGPRLCSPISDLMVENYHGWHLLTVVQQTYPEIKGALDKAGAKQQEAVVKWLDERPNDPQAKQFATWIRKYSEYEKLMGVLHRETGYGFRPLDKLRGVEAWTDDYADVMRVMMIPELQAIRRFFGLPTLADE